MPPGQITFTRSPCLTYSTARQRENDSTPPLEAAYAAIHGWQPSAAVDDMFTMLPLVFEQMGKRGLAHQERAGQVDREHPVPVLELELVGVIGAQDAGDVAQHVQAAEAFHHRG